ncbi:flagellar biosynthesis anti-sigma factor FlgM [Marinicrinis lubricantis]|uniref:Negative regulator of flagellin synthesis n=1 Tax=Marinicrinis lubricantis TaxID=2086470 RepID=A0ABW1ISX6_9BACL
MKINDIQRTGAVQRYQQNMAVSSGAAAKGKQKDSIHISSEAKELLQGTRSPERAEKLEQLKEAVSSGTYQVDAGKVAEKMLGYFKNPYQNG